jgi:hypothetical protein
MAIRIHPHAEERVEERGASEEEIIRTVKEGERFPAKFGRTGFRRNFHFGRIWRGSVYQTKQIEAYGVQEGEDWLIVTVITKYF